MSAEPIVVGVDGSAGASRAVDWALAWAAAVGAPLRVLASEPVPPGLTAGSPDLGGQARAAVEAEIARIESAIPDGVSVEPSPLVAHPVSALVQASKEAAAIVVGTRGNGAFRGGVIGSIAGAVAASTHCPTVVIPPGAASEFDSAAPLVVGFDGSESALAAAGLAVSAARLEGRAVRLIQAEKGLTSPEQPLDALVADLVADHPGVDVELVTVEGTAVDALVAHSRGAAFVVVASQGHRGVPGFLLGSTTRALVQSSLAPVMVLTARSKKSWPLAG